MAKVIKEKIGHMDCPACSKEVAVRINPQTEALSFPCGDCGFPGYAKFDGSDYYKKMLARVRKLPANDVPMDTSKPVPEVQEIPAKKTATIFG